MTNLEELERLHAEAMGLRDVLFRNRGLEVRETKESYECLNALPGLIAELRALREVAEAAREAVRASIGLTPEATHRIATALAKVPK